MLLVDGSVGVAQHVPGAACPARVHRPRADTFHPWSGSIGKAPAWRRTAGSWGKMHGTSTRRVIPRLARGGSFPMASAGARTGSAKLSPGPVQGRVRAKSPWLCRAPGPAPLGNRGLLADITGCPRGRTGVPAEQAVRRRCRPGGPDRRRAHPRMGPGPAGSAGTHRELAGPARDARDRSIGRACRVIRWSSRSLVGSPLWRAGGIGERTARPMSRASLA